MSRVPSKPPLGLKPDNPVRGTRGGLLHMRHVKLLPCIICGAPPPSQAHHCTGGGMARDDFKTIPLCYDDHQGPQGYHANKREWVARHGPDYGFLPRVNEMLNRRNP